MFFCPNCRNSYDITRTMPDAQTGGVDFNTVVDKILNGDVSKEDVVKLDLNLLLKSSAYKKLSTKKKELVFNKIQDLLPEDKKILIQNTPTEENEGNKAYFICRNCLYSRPINDGTLIYSKTSSKIMQSYDAHDESNRIYSEILPLTRKYVCPNKKCPSHTDFQKRIAAMYRLHNTFNLKYVCKACGTSWKP